MQDFVAGGVGLTFDHPRTWTESRFPESFAFHDLIAYVSNNRLHNPCTTTDFSGVVTTTCAEPIARLGPGGVLVSWSNVGYSHTGPEIPHPNVTIDGRPAHLSATRPGDCARLGAQETVTADIARPVVANHYEMVACLRDPGIAGNETLVRQMLASVRVTG